MHGESCQQDKVRGEKFRAVTDEGFPLDCSFISGAVKILKNTAITCDEGREKGRWVIHTKSGGWIVNAEEKRKIPFRRVGNVRVPDKGKDKSKDRMEVDGINTRSTGFTRPRR